MPAISKKGCRMNMWELGVTVNDSDRLCFRTAVE